MFFFFQAEDGIRDHCVTGVQTCALPISPAEADTVRLLIVNVLTLAAFVVVASIVTVLVVALVMKSATSLVDGAPSDQFPPVSHLPVPTVQLLECPGTATSP